MTELFESTIDNVSDMEVKGYKDPVENTYNMEIWIKTGDEEYIYKFSGPGVDKFEAAADGRCWKENKKLREAYEKLYEEKQQLKKENEEFGNQILEYIEMNNRLRREKEEREVSAVAAKEKNKLLEIENNKLREENSFLMERNQVLSEGNKDLRAGFDKVTKRAEELRKEINESKGLHYPITRERILEQAKECVCGQREQDYGTPESNFQLIADLWNGYLGFLDNPRWRQIRATDVAMMMALMKIARIRNGGGSGDSFVDLAGYAACGGEIWHGERHCDK